MEIVAAKAARGHALIVDILRGRKIRGHGTGHVAIAEHQQSKRSERRDSTRERPGQASAVVHVQAS